MSVPLNSSRPLDLPFAAWRCLELRLAALSIVAWAPLQSPDPGSTLRHIVNSPESTDSDPPGQVPWLQLLARSVPRIRKHNRMYEEYSLGSERLAALREVNLSYWKGSEEDTPPPGLHQTRKWAVLQHPVRSSSSQTTQHPCPSLPAGAGLVGLSPSRVWSLRENRHGVSDPVRLLAGKKVSILRPRRLRHADHAAVGGLEQAGG
ncbi:hypothetical protein BT67DRAFT_113313 [Trichocladium antarcticum]|uniref:Uncharacterized protein n=1 Tax=Trichocladium antarcticum TaxID=1450529 RepID=A0AAN6ZHC5_9PEZI|nr:hypothetical protein BT67DRAFT_113313 [Trichocladium antarcticum]